MIIKELIDILTYHIENADMPLSEDDAREIIKELEKYDELKQVDEKIMRFLDEVSNNLKSSK